MFKLNFISEENSNIYLAINGGFAVNELPETKIEDGFEVYVDDDEYLELNEYLSEGNDAEVVINWSTEIDFDTKIITINGEIEEEYEEDIPEDTTGNDGNQSSDDEEKKFVHVQ